MQFIADLHIHSKYARGCSNRLDVENIWKTCIIKGIDIIGTGDFTHPQRLGELQEFLESDGNGFFIPKQKFLKKRFEEVKPYLNESVIEKMDKGFYPRFVIQTEINNVFQRGEKKYRVHNVFLIDSFDDAQKILDYLGQFGKVESDGRLAVRQDQSETLLWLKTNFPQIIFFAGHIWTPHFGVLGSRLNFKGMKDAYLQSCNLMDAIETGLSSDPIMNWINSDLDNFAILSNSDAHSPENFAREANIFEFKNVRKFVGYKDLEKAIKSRKFENGDINDVEKDYLNTLFAEKNTGKLVCTIEFFPQEGKYFADGHSKCNFWTSPQDTVKRSGKCPICGGKITVGVLHRAFGMGNQKRIDSTGFGTKQFWQETEIDEISRFFGRPTYRYIVPLWDIIREVFNANKGTKKSQTSYNELIKSLGTEFDILLNISIQDAQSFNKFFGFALEKVRKSDIHIKPGYDGNFGIVSIKDSDSHHDSDLDDVFKQQTLF